MLKRTLVIIFAGLILVGPAFSQADLPAYSGYINDYAGVLSASQKQELEGVSSALKNKTGAELAVAIVKTVEPLDSKLYAVKLFEKWGIGEKGKDNGVLLLVAIEERRVEIEVGYGLEGVLTDARAGDILDSYAVPYFKEGKMGEGVLQAAKAIAETVAREELSPPPEPAPRAKAKVSGTNFIVVIIILVILGIVLRRAGSIFFGLMGAIWGIDYGLAGMIIGGLLGFFFGFWGIYFFGRGGGGMGRGGGGFGGFGGGRSGGGGAGRGF